MKRYIVRDPEKILTDPVGYLTAELKKNIRNLGKDQIGRDKTFNIEFEAPQYNDGLTIFQYNGKTKIPFVSPISRVMLAKDGLHMDIYKGTGNIRETKYAIKEIVGDSLEFVRTKELQDKN